MIIKVANFLSKERIIFFEQGTKKKDALNKLIDLITTSDKVIDKEKFKEDIWNRESILSTGIGLGIAIPHAKSQYVDDIVIAMGISKDGIDYDSLDGEPVNFIIMIAAHSSQHQEYLKILAKVALVLKSPKKREKILQATTSDDIFDIFKNV